MIKVDQVTRFYGEHKAVDNLSFEARKGSIHGFLGPNGAGKTTTMKMIAALLPPHAGSITIDSIDVVQNPEEIKKRIGLLLEIPPLFMDMQTREYLEFAAKLHLVPKKLVSRQVDEVLEKMNLEKVQDRIIGNLSKGFKQKVGVAQAIVHNPSVVILDEPTSGLDPRAVMEMRELIRSLKSEHTILFSSHLLKEADILCDDVTIIANGKLMASSSVEEIGKSLSEKTVTRVLTQKINDQAIEDLKKEAFIENVLVEQEAGFVRLSVFSDSLEDRRSVLSKFFVDHGLGLLEMTQEKPDLEQIFLKVVERGKN